MHFQSNMAASSLRRRNHVSFALNEIVRQMIVKVFSANHMKLKFMTLLKMIKKNVRKNYAPSNYFVIAVAKGE
jgi:hypothetical protein